MDCTSIICTVVSKGKKTYKTSSIPIVNTDGPKTKTNKNFGVQGLWKKKNGHFYAFRNSEMWLRKEKSESPQNFSMTWIDLFSDRFGDFF